MKLNERAKSNLAPERFRKRVQRSKAEIARGFRFPSLCGAPMHRLSAAAFEKSEEETLAHNFKSVFENVVRR